MIAKKTRKPRKKNDQPAKEEGKASKGVSNVLSSGKSNKEDESGAS